MIVQITRLAYRNLLKNRAFTLINLIGLATSMAASIIIFTYYTFESSYDRHIPDADRTYRLISRLGEGEYWARTFACYRDALANRPELKNLTAFIGTTDNIIKIEESSFTVSEAVIADTSFLDFFAIDMISGRKEDLGLPNKVFITRELAQILFPGSNPIGKDVFFNQFAGNTGDSLGHFTVAGIVNPLPQNTHFGFQMIFSQEGNLAGLIKHLKGGKWFSANVYVRLHSNKMFSELESGLTDAVVPFLKGKQGPPIEAFNSRIQAVRQIHFTTDINREPRPVVRKSMIYILLSVGFLILILMTLNFIGTAIVQSHQQRKDTGVIRALGANNFQLFQLSLFKIGLYVGMGLLISWAVIASMESYLKDLFGSGWSFRSLSSQIFIGGLVVGFPITILVALGMHLSGWRFSTDDLLKRKADIGKRTWNVFGMLTILQFTIVIVLLGFAMAINRQIIYMNKKDLGYLEKNVVVVRIPSQNPRGSLLVEEIRNRPGVISASTAHHHPGDLFQSMDFSTGDKTYQFGFRMVDPGIFEILGINLIRRYGAQDGKMEGWVINETFFNSLLKDFSEEDIAASNFRIDNDDPQDSRSRFIIAGVMEDFHYSSLHNQIGNFAFAMRSHRTAFNRWLLVRYKEGHADNVMASIHKLMDTHFQGRNYNVFLLEDNLHDKYGATRKLSKVISVFAILSIFIASFGLYGLSMFITQRRTKEIGIRKVFGARSGQILSLLNLGFLKWIGIAIIIAWPLTIWMLNRWLQSFAYKTSMPWWIFLFLGLIVAAITLIAVTLQTGKAARSNPVQSIRYE